MIEEPTICKPQELIQKYRSDCNDKKWE